MVQLINLIIISISCLNNEEPIKCWNYRAKYNNSTRLYEIKGSGKFPGELRIPKSVDISTGMMIDEGKLINPGEFKIVQ